MSISSILNIATSGLKAASVKAQTSAQNLANIRTADYSRQETATTSLVTGTSPDSGAGVQAQIIDSQYQEGQQAEAGFLQDVINLTKAETAYNANATVLKTGEELQRSLLDIQS